MVILKSVQDTRLPELLLKGQVGVIPTDTIYGLAALAGDKSAVQKLYDLKQRERKPGTLIAANPEQLISLGLDEAAIRAVARLWPNPLSIIILAAPKLHYLNQGLDDLAVRIPADDEVCRLLEKTGPLLTSSANFPSQPPASNIEEARVYFGDQLDFYVEGGDLSGRPPSTVARFTDGQLEILRQGAVIIDEQGNVARGDNK